MYRARIKKETRMGAETIMYGATSRAGHVPNFK